MRWPIAILLLLAPSIAIGADSLLVHQLYPLLPYIFFDSASAEIPQRYVRFGSYEQTLTFDEQTLVGDPLAKHHRVLDVIGSRMRRYPKTRVELVGFCSPFSREGETLELAKSRRDVVARYLIEVWRIEAERIAIAPSRPGPDCMRSRPGASVLAEWRSTQIWSKDWEIVAPIVQFDERSSDTMLSWSMPGRLIAAVDGRSQVMIAPLILYEFDSPGLGRLNQRIVKEYFQPEIASTDSIIVVGQTDVVGLDDRNMDLSIERARHTADAIRTNSRRPMAIEHRGIGESALFDNALPEGRYLNRTVIVMVWRKKKQGTER